MFLWFDTSGGRSGVVNGGGVGAGVESSGQHTLGLVPANPQWYACSSCTVGAGRGFGAFCNVSTMYWHPEISIQVPETPFGVRQLSSSRSVSHSTITGL